METKINSAGEQQPVDGKSRYAKMDTAELGEQSEKAKKVETAVKDLSGFDASKTKERILKGQGEERKSGNAELTNRDWARIYGRLGDEKCGSHVDKRKNGDRVFALHKMEKLDNPKIVIISGTYESPKLKGIIEFDNEEEMFEALERLKQ